MMALQTFVPCVVYKSCDTLKEEWKRVLNNTSLELLALCKTHYNRVLNEQLAVLQALRRIEANFTSKDTIRWEMKQFEKEEKLCMREKEMKEVRKKVKHAIRVHREGRVFTEYCLREGNSNNDTSQTHRGGRDKEWNDSSGTVAQPRKKDVNEQVVGTIRRNDS